ncbi:maltase-glucoamylase-like [Chamaea fasciata]|uniref:maltase-glucoamylase-like n=1 Tax=Chamaea fasciata TaxID=190680 RepID=UPI00336A9800
MGRFSRLELALGALFLVGVAVAGVLLGILGTQEPKSRESGFSPRCPNVSLAERIDCAPDHLATESLCRRRGCCWSPLGQPGVPWCFFSSDHGYRIEEGPRETEQGVEVSLRRLGAPSLFGRDSGSVLLRAQFQSSARLRLQFTDPTQPRFEVPHDHVGPFLGPAAADPKYRLEFRENPFGIRVIRARTGAVVFDTTIGPLIFSDQFLQISTRIPSGNLYGLGEQRRGRLKHQLDWRTWALFSRHPNANDTNLSGVQPFFLCLEDKSGASLGVFLMNSNAMEVALSPAPAVTFRTIGGILDFYLFLGDTPEQVVQEYVQFLGLPALPPYWSLGFQLSRSSYGSLEQLKAVVERNRQIQLPYDVQYADVEAMDRRRDFTYDQTNFGDLPKFREFLSAAGQKFLITLDAAIAADGDDYGTFQRGSQRGVWVNESDGVTPLIGEARPGRAVFPDFSNPECVEWWEEEMQRFHQIVPYDGVWIDMNEATTFVPGSVRGCADNGLNFPPYTPSVADVPLFRRSLCPDAVQAWGRLYDLHNLYGHGTARATRRALSRLSPGLRPFLVSGSTFSGSGRLGGHFLGDTAATWGQLRAATPTVLEFGLFGIPYVGGPICGSWGGPSEELCRRWAQLGAFFPLARNHNGDGGEPQDPAWFGADSALVGSARHYLNIRYRLLPYLYSLLRRAHARGDTVTRPLLHEFYAEEATWDVDEQFLWGPGLLITPVLEPGVEVISAYIPDAVWYEFESGSRLWLRGTWTHLYLPGDRLGLHLRGGVIFPTQEPATTTATSRRNPMGLIVALDENQEATGELFWDDGESADTVATKSYISYNFRFSNNILELSVTHNNYSDPHGLHFRELRLLGLPRAPLGVAVTDGAGGTVASQHNVTYDAATKVAVVQGLQLRLGQSYAVTLTLGTRDIDRFDCHPGEGASPERCRSLGCVWNETTSAQRVPYCHYDGPDNGYVASEIRYWDTGATAAVSRERDDVTDDIIGDVIGNLSLQVTFHTDHLLQFKISDPSARRYEVPVPLSLPDAPQATPQSRLYDVTIQDRPFGVQVRRRSTGTVIWDSQLPTFTFGDRFLQISTRLPTPAVFGFGENEHRAFRHEMDWNTWGMFARDQPPGYKLNSYGFQPFYMGLEEDGHAHGVLLLNSNAMDVTFQPTPALTYRTIGGILDFYLVLGPTPEQVVQEYTQLVGRPMLPPYWALGFQLCRYGYESDAEIADLVQEMNRARIPLDVQYADIDYMERQLDFTLSPRFQGLPELVRKIRNDGMRFVLILDPAISANETNYPAYKRGVEQDVFIKWPDSNDIIFAKVWPDLPDVAVDDSLDWDTQVELFRAFTAMPDFFRNSTRAWWAQEISEVYENPQNSSLSIKFDGIWIDMNEPSSFVHGTVGGCRDRELNFPPYMPQLGSRSEGLSFKTLCMEGQQHLPDGSPVRHYDVHNLYGWAQTEPTLQILQNLTGERGIVVTRSTFPSSGRWAGHWLGDNTAAWEQLDKSIIGMMEFSLFGISYTGADICGFFGEPSYELCARWMELGAFYPYSRNHNGNKDKRQDPVSWNSTFEELSRAVLELRYQLLPHLYTLMFRAHADGSTVVRPLLHEFVSDKTTWDIHRQFLWGPGLLVSPVLEQGAAEVSAYLPDARWFDFHTDEEVGFRGQFRNFPAPLGHVNVHVRGGHVVPQQLPAINTQLSRRNPLLLTVALDDALAASGSLYWDDGVSIDTFERGEYLLMSFTARPNILELRTVHDGYKDPNSLKFTEIKILGIAGNIQKVTVTRDGDGVASPHTFTHDPEKKVLKITRLELELGQNHTLQWA